MIDAPWNEATAHEIGIAWIETNIAPAGRLGRIAAATTRAFLPGDEEAARAAIASVARVAAQTSEAQANELGGFFAAIPDPAQALAIVRSGNAPSDADFFELARFTRGALALAERAVAGAFDGRAFSNDERDALDDAASEFARVSPGPSGFYLESGSDPEVANAREAAERAREAATIARSRVASAVAKALGRETLASPEFIVMRDELAEGALPEGARIVAEGATYLVCELVLGADALAALAAAEAADAVVAACEERVRRELAARIGIHATSLASAARRVGELDLFAARVRFARTYSGCVPEFARESSIGFHDVRYLPLESQVASLERAYTPLSFSFERAAVITGPNMGGKSVALRTCGFAVACAAFGLPLPARAARVRLVRTLAWLGAQRGGGEEAPLLSAFGREVVEARALLDAPPTAMLVLLDEFARTTTPLEGRALLVAMLERLRDLGASVLAATHFSGVAEAARATHFAIAGLRATLDPGATDLEDALRRVARAMDYRLVAVDAGSLPRSDAIELAAALGLDASVVSRAREVLAN